MWVLYFLLAVPLCECAAVGKFSEENGAEYLVHGSGIEDIKVKMAKIANEFLEDLMAAQSPRGNRQKREMRDIKPSSLADKTGVFRLQTIKPFLHVCSRPTDITFVQVGHSSLSVCISTPADDTPTTANIVRVNTTRSSQLDSWFTNNPSKAVSFTYGQQVYVLVADSGRGDGTDLIKFDVSTQKSHVDHTVHSTHATAIALWKMKKDGRYHLAIANSNGNKDAYDLTSEIFTYTWMETYFDKYSSISAYDVKDIEPFHIHNMAYLAVANHRRGVGNYHVDSEILKYNLDQAKWLSLQKIRTYGAMDWEFFTLGHGTGKEFFLAVANYVEQGNHEINSVIYKFVKDKFVPFQCVLTRGATSIAALSDDPRFLLAIANEYEAVYLYQYNGWRFVRASVQYTQSTMSAGVTSVSFHTVVDYEAQKLVLAVSNNKIEGPSLYEVEFVKENTLDMWYNNSTEWCMNVLDEIEKSESHQTLIDMNNVIYTDKLQEVVIDGTLNFNDGFQASIIMTPKVIDVKKKITYDDSILVKLRDLKLRLQMIEDRLRKGEEILRKAVSITRGQILSGNYSFKDVTLNCGDHSCHFEKVETVFLNGEDITELKNNVIFINDEVFVDQPLNVENIKVGNLAIAGLLDGVNVSKVVTKSGSHHITGTKTFFNSITSNVVDVAGLIDGEKVTPYTVLLDGEYQNVTGKLTFTEIETSSLEVSKFVNEVDLNNFYRNLVMSDKSYTIEGRKTFSNIVVKDLNAKYVDGVDLSELWNNVMWRNEEQIIPAPMSFSNVAAENVLVNGHINRLKVPGPEVLLVNSSGVINSNKLFEKTTKISNMVVSGSINSIGVLKNKLGLNRLNLLLKNENQVITGRKTFRDIFLGDHSYVSGTVNGIDLSELQDSAWRKNTTTTSVGTWIFKNLEIKGPLTVHGLVDETNLNAIYHKALKLEDTLMPNFSSVDFKGVLHVQDLQTPSVNGLDVTENLVLTKEQDSVKGKIGGFKTFHDMNLEADSDVLGLVNRLNISLLQEVILRLGNQVITKHLTADGNFIIKNLTVKGLLNNVPFSEFVTLSGRENITGHKIFSNTEAGNLKVGNLTVAGLINEMDIEAEVENTMTYDDEQMISGPKSVTGKIILSENSNFNTESLNEIDISSVWEDAVRIDVPQNISGNKVFSEEVTFTSLWFHESLDEVTEWDLKYNWMVQDLEQEVFGDVILSKGADVRHIQFSGYINDVNIVELNNTIAKRTEPSVIAGPVIFEGNVISYGSISLTGSVQNVDLSEEAVFKSKHNIIAGEKEFLSDVSITGDVTVLGLIDKVSTKDLCENSVLLEQNTKLNDLTVVGNVVFEGGVKIGGLLAGIDIDILSGLKAGNEETFITGSKSFENLTIQGPVTIHGKIGGVDIKFLESTYMSLSRPQDIQSPLNFESLEVKGALSTSSFYTHDNKINGIDIVELQSRLLRTSGIQSINATYRFDEVTFADDVIVVGRVNDIEIPKGLMRQNRANYVYNSKVFKQNLTVLGDLVMEDGKTVHEIDVSEWEKQSVLKDGGKYFIDGWKSFNKVTLNDLRIDGTLNGVKISEDNLLMMHGEQTVKDKKVVGNVGMLRNITIHGLINRVDLADLARRAARRYKNNTFSGVKYFSQPVIIASLETKAINGIDIGELYKTIHAKLNFDVLSNRMTELKEAVSEMQGAFDNQAVLFQYYEYFQGFKIPGSYLWRYVTAPDVQELLLLSDFSLLKNGCTSIRLFEFSTEKKWFESKQKSLLASYAVAMDTTFIWDSTYLFVANRMPSNKCSSVDTKYALASGNERTAGQIFVWDKEDGMFKVHQTIPVESATDVAVFSDQGFLCAVYTELEDTKVYCADENHRDFTFRETLQTTHGTKVSLIEDQSDWPVIRLAVAGFDSVRNRKYVDIYNWNSEAGAFGQQIQRIASNADSVSFMLHPNTYSIFLVMSDKRTGLIVPRLLIYKLKEKENEFLKYQEINDSGYLEWVILPSGELMFFVLSMDGNLNIYRHRYSSRFVREDTIYSTGAKTLHAFDRIASEDSNHYLALAGPQSILPHEYEELDSAKILKSNIKGKRLY